MSTRIKLLVMDVDGTLTDGMIYMGRRGEIFKAFNVKDGCGIKDILPQYGIVPVILTARKSKILEKRCRELNITEIYQGVSDKVKKLHEILEDRSAFLAVGLSMTDIAYIGDDITDLSCMKEVKTAGGIVGCPNDAALPVKEIADFISTQNGGCGAVREFIDWLCCRNQD